MILHICPMQVVRDSGLPDTVTALSVELGRVSPATCEVEIKFIIIIILDTSCYDPYDLLSIPLSSKIHLYL